VESDPQQFEDPRRSRGRNKSLCEHKMTTEYYTSSKLRRCFTVFTLCLIQVGLQRTRTPYRITVRCPGNGSKLSHFAKIMICRVSPNNTEKIHKHKKCERIKILSLKYCKIDAADVTGWSSKLHYLVLNCTTSITRYNSNPSSLSLPL